MLGRGNPVTVVCDLVNIDPTTYYDWLGKSEQVEREGHFDSPLYQFSHRCKAAQAKAEEKALRIVIDAAVGGRKITKTVIKRKFLVAEDDDPDWGRGNEGQRLRLETDRKLIDEETTTTVEEALPDARAAMWFLERRNRKEYGRTVGLTNAEGSGPVEVKRISSGELLGQLDDDGLEKLEALLLASSGDPDAGGVAGGESPPGS